MNIYTEAITNATKHAPLMPKSKNFLLKYIFHVEFFGKVTFSSPCIVEKWHFGMKPIQKSDVFALSP